MEFSFGIITDGNSVNRVNDIVNSIVSQNIPNFDIVVIGGTPLPEQPCLKHVPFDETVKEKWVTKKKNLITQHTKYENIVYMHDYVGLDANWYNGFLKFGNNWDICMTIVKDILGRRFYDWISWDHPDLPCYSPLDYDDSFSGKYTFIPGGYWTAKRYVMEKCPLNEELSWGQSEDIDWTYKVRHYKYVMNKNSSVTHLKEHRGFSTLHAIY